VLVATIFDRSAAAIKSPLLWHTRKSNFSWLEKPAPKMEKDKEVVVPSGEDGATVAPRRRRWRLPRWKGLIAAVGVALVCGSSAASGSMWWQQRVAAQKRQLTAEFDAAARQAAIALLAIDYTKTEEHVQRVLDNSTGEFKSRFEKNAAKVAERAQQSKVVATADVKDAAVESMSDNAGVVLVAVRTESTEMNGQRQPTSWRLALSLTRDDGRLKMSDVDFVE
jgi:Mce-associated membrane protein